MESTMHADHQVSKDLWESPGRSEIAWDEEGWQRWDDDLVEDFGRWLTGIAKTSVVLSCVVFSGLITLWIWSTF